MRIRPRTRGQPRLLDEVRGVIRRLHYSIRTEQTYLDWIRPFILSTTLRVVSILMR